MMRLKSKLLSLNASKKEKVKVYSPRNCEELRIPFKTDKVAKVVGKLASIPPPTSVSTDDGGPEQIVTGVLVQNDFKLSLMAPEDLREYAGLTTTTITCKQRLRLSAAGIDLIRWGLEGTFGSIEELPEMKKQKNGAATTEEADEEVNGLVAAYLVMGCVTVRYYSNGQVELEWEGNMLNDGIADSVMAVLFSVESSPAAVKRTPTPPRDGSARRFMLTSLQVPRLSTPTRTPPSCPRATCTPTSHRRSVSSGFAGSSRRSSAPRTLRPSASPNCRRCRPGRPPASRRPPARTLTRRRTRPWTSPTTRAMSPRPSRRGGPPSSTGCTAWASPYPAC